MWREKKITKTRTHLGDLRASTEPANSNVAMSTRAQRRCGRIVIVSLSLAEEAWGEEPREPLWQLHEKPPRQIGFFFAFITKMYGGMVRIWLRYQLDVQGCHICQNQDSKFEHARTHMDDDTDDDAIELHGHSPMPPPKPKQPALPAGGGPPPVFSFEREAPRDNLGVAGDTVRRGDAKKTNDVVRAAGGGACVMP
jgi:hypothetical protein